MNALITRLAAVPVNNALLSVGARALLALIFILGGYSKIGGYDGTAAFMTSMGVPASLLPVVIVLELGGGLALLAGFQTRLVAALLAGFCVISGLIFHSGADQLQQILLMKNIAIAGGLLALVRTGPGAVAVDKD